MTTLMLWETWEESMTEGGINAMITCMIVTKMVKRHIKNITTIKRPWPVDVPAVKNIV